MAGTRRIYLLLAAIRLYFALSPSYIHPDEHFQGPEVVAGELFHWNITQTWEFTSEKPIRSFVPLLWVYAPTMTVMQWILQDKPDPKTVFYALRALFYFFSMVYEDWAILELVSSTAPNAGLLLSASSWVTWTIQTRTFSNSLETVVLLWTLVLVQRIISTKGTIIRDGIVLAAFIVFGTFNRITFPAFLIAPGVTLLRHFVAYPLSFFSFVIPAALLTIAAVILDTSIYAHKPILSLTLSDLVITPLNNLLYNSSVSNLAQHGLHPFYNHFLVNLPQLLGPAFIPFLLSLNLQTLATSLPLQSAVSGVISLSLFRHQEARFLIPVVPLILSSISIPTAPTLRKVWISTWMIFNLLLGILMGVYHQGGVVPAQLYISQQPYVDKVVYWKTYKPPTWLLGENTHNITTIDLMGSKIAQLVETINEISTCADGENESPNQGRKLVVAPTGAVLLDPYVYRNESQTIPDDGFLLHMVYKYSKHLNLDDMDFGDDGILPTLERVVGRRGIAVYEVEKLGCGTTDRLRDMAKGKIEFWMEKLSETGDKIYGVMEGVEERVREVGEDE